MMTNKCPIELPDMTASVSLTLSEHDLVVHTTTTAPSCLPDALFPYREMLLRRRQQIFGQMWQTYGAEKVPIIIGSTKLKLAKDRFLVDSSMTMGQFSREVRSLCSPKPDALFMFTREKNIMPLSSMQVWHVAERYRDREDGFLYLVVTSENCFGASPLSCTFCP